MRAQIEAELRSLTVAQATESVRAARWGWLTTCTYPPTASTQYQTLAKKAGRRNEANRPGGAA